MPKKWNAGDSAEAVVEQSLIILKSEWDEMARVHHSQSGGEVDSLQTDFLVFLRSGLAFPLQVKSSVKPLRKHRGNYPYIMAIMIRKDDNPEMVAEKIKRLILRCYKRIRENSLSPVCHENY